MTILFSTVFFAFLTVIIAIDTKKSWRRSAEEIEHIFQGQWHSLRQRRMRMATPAGLAIGLGFDLVGVLALVDSVIGDFPRWIVLGGFAVVVAAFAMAAAALTVGWPRFLLLPAFRPREVYRRALAER